MKKRRNKLVLIVLLVAMVCIGFAIASYTYSQPIPNPGHGGDSVFININGNNTDLQTAINNNEFNSCSITGSSYSLPIIHGHRGEEVIVNVNGTIKTLQEAINDSSLVKAEALTSPSNFGAYNYGNNGDEVLINISGVEKTLQQAINNGDFYACFTPIEINLALLPSVTAEYQILYTWGADFSNNPEAIKDDDISTFFQQSCGGIVQCAAKWDLILNFSIPYTINRVEYLRYGYFKDAEILCARGAATDTKERVFLLKDGSWQLINIRDFYTGPAALENISSGGPWTNVSAVKLELSYCIYNSHKQLGSTSYVYELRAFGTQ